MFLFFRKIMALINMYGSLPDNYADLKFIRNFTKILTLKDSEEERLFSMVSAVYNCTNNSSTIDVKDNSILFITHELSRTGAPKVALETLKAIKSIYGINPVVISMRDGEMRKDFVNAGFELHFANELSTTKQGFQNFCNQFKLVFVSSVATDFLYCVKYINAPIIWYSHEILKNESDYAFFSKFANNFSKILCGSPLTKQSVEARYKDFNTKLLIYGLKEENIPTVKKDTDKFIFICPASIEDRKNQKALIEAIKLLPDEVKNKILLYIIGSPFPDSKDYYNEVIKMAEGINEIKFIPNVPMNELIEYYGKADCVICPSKQDPMPIVVTYAFMFKKLALISDTIGQSLLAQNGENAILFNPEDANQLKNCITDIVNNKEKYLKIAQNGRKIYDDYFSIEMFNKNLKESLDEYLL